MSESRPHCIGCGGPLSVIRGEFVDEGGSSLVRHWMEKCPSPPVNLAMIVERGPIAREWHSLEHRINPKVE